MFYQNLIITLQNLEDHSVVKSAKMLPSIQDFLASAVLSQLPLEFKFSQQIQSAIA
jgi:hypothetical protein